MRRLLVLFGPLLWGCAAALLAGCPSGGGGDGGVKPPPEQLQRGSLIEKARSPKKGGVYYRPPRLEERLVLQQVLPRFYADLSAGKIDLEGYAEQFRKAGFRLHRLRRGEEIWVALSEGGQEWRGTGVYVFRVGDGVEETILQAPHTYFDRETGVLAERLFEMLQVRGLFFNTMHRYRPYPEASETDGVNPADLAHVTDSFFHMLSVEYLSAVPEATLVQLHGFDRHALEERNVGIVLSDGTESPSESIRGLRRRFGDDFASHRIALYPEETRFYGATSNAQANWTNTYGRGTFIHVELSDEVRSQLVNDDEWLYRLGKVLQPSR